MISIKRIYEKPAPDDGYRVLVDRLWPRGVGKKEAKLDLWLKEISPSPELREWFSHRPERFMEFTKRYQTELESNDKVADLVRLTKEHKHITLLYGTRNPHINHAVVLQDYLLRHLS